MPLSTLGTAVDILDERRIYSNVTVDRIFTSRWSLADEYQLWPGQAARFSDQDRLCVHIDTLDRQKLTLDCASQWRPRVTRSARS
ncbi:MULTISPECIES: hypothetical protein [unclassified Brevibacterium]|uniref:hypothetical protein n=1 Tax=unclassified Brevibacterium TaxID=2614124 RepID=UPI001E56557A|nr:MULTISPECIES: hypothetical protein [unclassified Brevibacterium]MDK8436418.1 hypothetical protein [Brevibacterium sp. H-BE7]